MNLLILSCGTRNKIIRYFKNALSGRGNVIATDMSEYAPALYEADRFYLVPRITDPDYINIVLDICKKENISGVLSLIDPELLLLAKNRERFAAAGVNVIGSSEAACELSFDKMQMFRFLSSHGYRCARSYDNTADFFADVEAGVVSYPVFVKPICGSASIATFRADDRETVEFLFRKYDGLMVQEFLPGCEIGADCYIDLVSGEVVSIFTKRKIVMRAGETDKAVSFKDPALFDLITRFAKEAGFCGQIDIDLFEDNGTYYISEVNPRFGGGYPHAYECGVDHMKLIAANLEGRANEKRIGDYEENIYMFKYNEIMTIRL